MKINTAKVQSGRTHSIETRKKMSLKQSGEKNPSFGMGYRQLGEKITCMESHILQEGVFLKEYKYLKEVD